MVVPLVGDEWTGKHPKDAAFAGCRPPSEARMECQANRFPQGQNPGEATTTLHRDQLDRVADALLH
jgi:hypothetical protein